MSAKFTAADFTRLQNLPYKRPSLVRLLKNLHDPTDDFHCYVLSLEQPIALAFNQLMTEFAGDPSGIEFQHKSGTDRWAFVLPDVHPTPDSSWRVQYLDLDGFQSHHCEPTMLKAIDTMVGDGFVTPSRGVLDHLCITQRWNRGVEIAGLMFRLNTKAITYTQFVELVSALEPA